MDWKHSEWKIENSPHIIHASCLTKDGLQIQIHLRVILKHDCVNTPEYILIGPVISVSRNCPGAFTFGISAGSFYLPMDTPTSGSHVRASPLFCLCFLFTLAGTCGNLATCNLFIQIVHYEEIIACFFLWFPRSMWKSLPLVT